MLPQTVILFFTSLAAICGEINYTSQKQRPPRPKAKNEVTNFNHGMRENLETFFREICSRVYKCSCNWIVDTILHIIALKSYKKVYDRKVGQVLKYGGM